MIRTGIIILALAGVLSGCASKGDVRDLDQAVAAMQARVRKLEDQNDAMKNLNVDSFTGVRAALMELNRRDEQQALTNQQIRADFAKLQATVEEALTKTRTQLEDIRAMQSQLSASGEMADKEEERYQKTQQSLADFQAEYARHLRDLQKTVEEMDVSLKAMQARLEQDSNTP